MRSEMIVALFSLSSNLNLSLLSIIDHCLQSSGTILHFEAQY